LADIKTKLMLTGEVPQDWRDANVVPIYKKGNRSEPGNYRPVSLTWYPVINAQDNCAPTIARRQLRADNY